MSVAMAWSCGPCRDEHGFAGGKEYEPGSWSLGPMHDTHVPELVLAGWIVTYPDGPDEPPDVACPHYHAEHLRDGEQ